MVQEKQQKRDLSQSKGAREFSAEKTVNLTEKSKAIGLRFLWLFAITMLISLVCFAWNDSMNVQFIPGNLSKAKIVAETPFEFESKVKTRKLIEKKMQVACNVYVVDESRYENFIKALKLLDERLEKFSYESVLNEHGRNEIKEFVKEFKARGPIKIEWQDAALIITSLSQIERTHVFQECISLLREVAREGVYSEDLLISRPNGGSTKLHSFKLKGKQQQHVRTMEDAFSHIRAHLLSLELDKDMVAIMFKILRQGVRPNLVFDAEESKVDANSIVRSIKPVIVKYEAGDVILEPNTLINEETYEAFVAHQNALRASHRNGHASFYMFFTKTFLTFLVVTISFTGLKLFAPHLPNCRRRYYLLSALIFLQLVIFRAYMQCGELGIFVKNPTYIYFLYCAAPFLLAPTMGTLLLGIADGLAISVIISVLHTLMLARPIDFCLSVLFVCSAHVLLLRSTSSKSKLFAYTSFSGLVFAVLIVIHGICAQFSSKVVFWQTLSAFVMSTTTGIVALILLPFLEKIFSAHTDIGLLKLTDYRNPLLQRLQLLAPGTYQHSLIVSLISEQVADSINANKVVCKTAALFHDLGKISKPEYFIENQSNHTNPHDKQTPYISSLIVRNHVREGVAIASASKLPKIITDIISEHHGTTVTQFFYDKAQSEFLAEISRESETPREIGKHSLGKLDKNDFRYDGPRPRSKESLIIMVADSIEAASRSMKRVTHQSIENLVEDVFETKIRDHQLDECPITLDEVNDLKESLTFFMINILHSRISYGKNKANESQES